MHEYASKLWRKNLPVKAKKQLKNGEKVNAIKKKYPTLKSTKREAKKHRKSANTMSHKIIFYSLLRITKKHKITIKNRYK